MEYLTNSFIIDVLITTVGILGTLSFLVDVPFPPKYTWFVTFLIFTVYGLLHTLYEIGGRYIVLYPVLFILTTVVQTTGVIALCISVYSEVNDNKISSHWYAIPTGCAPLAMITQYIPSHIVQAFFVGVTVLYLLIQQEKKNIIVGLSLILIGSSHWIAVKTDGMFLNLSFYHISNICILVAYTMILLQSNPRFKGVLGKSKKM
jgi:hypothetical protein